MFKSLLAHRSGHCFGDIPSAAPDTIAKCLSVNADDFCPPQNAHGPSVILDHFHSASLASCKRGASTGAHPIYPFVSEPSSGQTFSNLFLRFCGPLTARLSFLRNGNTVSLVGSQRHPGPSLENLRQLILYCLRHAATCLRLGHITPSFIREFFPQMRNAKFGATLWRVRLALSAIANVVNAAAFGSKLRYKDTLGFVSLSEVTNSFEVLETESRGAVFIPSALQDWVIVTVAVKTMAVLSKSLACVRRCTYINHSGDSVSDQINPWLHLLSFQWQIYQISTEKSGV